MIRYLVIWIALLCLTAATCLLSFAPTGRASLPIALGIAITKSALVVLFFMHLWEQRGAYRMVLGVSLAMLALLIGLTVADVATRFAPARPQTPIAGVPPEMQLPKLLPGSNPVNPVP